MSRHFSARARIESWMSVVVGIGTVLTTVKRSLNGSARRKSSSKILECHSAAAHSSGCQCANALLSPFEQLEMNEKIKM